MTASDQSVASATRGRRPWLPPRWFVRSFWHAHRGVVRISRGRLGLWEPTPKRWGTLRLTTTGRRTGRSHSVLVGYFEDGDNLVTLAMNGWGPGEPAWWLNLQSHPDAVVETRRGHRRVHAHCAQGAERDRLWARWGKIDHNLDAYAALRPAETAVVVLSSDDDMTVRVAGAPASVRPAVEAALAAQGFGVLTEIDVAATLKKKLDKDVPAQVILGACNPYLADRALAAEPSIGLLLPCNVVLRDDGNERTIVSALDPAVMVKFTGNADLEPVAAQARAKLEAALKSIVAPDDAQAAER